MKFDITTEDLNVYLKDFYEEVLEGIEIKEVLDNTSNFDKKEIVKRFRTASCFKPSDYDYLNSIKELIKKFNISSDEDLSLFNKTIYKLFVDFCKETMFKLIGIDLKNYTKNKIFIFKIAEYHSNVPPQIVFFNEMSNYDILICKVFSTKDNSIVDLSILNLHPFDLEVFKELNKEWNINFHKETLKNLTSNLS